MTTAADSAAPVMTAATVPKGGFRSLIGDRLAWLFLAYAIPAMLFLEIAMPPFQVADERAHSLRADQIARGRPIPARIGGRVDADLATFAQINLSLHFHPNLKQTVEMSRQAGAMRWTGAIDTENFQNTVQYGPYLYIPQALGLLFGKAVDLTLPQTLLVMRMVNGAVACILGFFAIAVCRKGKAILFATLLLPMTLSEFASASQDALIIALSALVIALASRILVARRNATIAEFVLFGCVTVATTLARPAQLALVLLAPAFIGRADSRWRAKLLWAMPGIFAIVGWMCLLPSLMPPMRKDWSMSGQFAYLLADPLSLPIAMLQTFWQRGWRLLGTLVGNFGWVDTPMPGWYIGAALVALLAALAAPRNREPVLFPAVLAILTFIGLLTAVCFALYLSWTPVGKPTVDGLQGRYLLPVLPLLGWLVPAYGPRLARLLRPAWIVVLLFPVVTLATLPGVIMTRYYGDWPTMAASLKALFLP